MYNITSYLLDAELIADCKRTGLSVWEDEDVIFIKRHGEIKAAFGGLATTAETLKQLLKPYLGTKEVINNV